MVSDDEVEMVPFVKETPRLMEKGKAYLKSYRFTPDVHDGLDRLKERLGAKSKNEALRIVFRRYGISAPASLFREIDTEKE